jgi:hypothetical protein
MTKLPASSPAAFDVLMERLHHHQELLNYSPRTWESQGAYLRLFGRFLSSRGVNDVQMVSALLMHEFQRWLFHEPTPHGGARSAVPRVGDCVILERLRVLLLRFTDDVHALEELVGMGTAEFGLATVLGGVRFRLRAHVLEVIDAADGHFGASSGLVVVEHVLQGVEKDFEVVLREAGALGENR